MWNSTIGFGSIKGFCHVCGENVDSETSLAFLDDSIRLTSVVSQLWRLRYALEFLYMREPKQAFFLQFHQFLRDFIHTWEDGNWLMLIDLLWELVVFFLYTAVQFLLFQSLGHTRILIHELNKVVRGLDNSSAPIFKTFGGKPSLPVAFLMFNVSSTARIWFCVTGLTLMVCFHY